MVQLKWGRVSLLTISFSLWLVTFCEIIKSFVIEHLFVIYLSSIIYLFEIGSHYVGLVVLELTETFWPPS